MKAARSIFLVTMPSISLMVVAVLLTLFIVENSSVVNNHHIGVVALQSSSSSFSLSSQLWKTSSSLSSSSTTFLPSKRRRNSVVNAESTKTALWMAAIPPHQQQQQEEQQQQRGEKNKDATRLDGVAIPATVANVVAYMNGRWNQNAKELFAPIPPPEDQFIITGDIAVLFMYAFTSHSMNDSIVQHILNNHDQTLVQSIQDLDPTGTIVNTHATSVWVNTANDPVAVQHALEVAARESFMNHWGPLLSTEGSACVALCSCWLFAGYLHRAFLYKNSTYCDSSQALRKTMETWITSALLLATLAIGTDVLIGHGPPLLQNLLCVTCHNTPDNQLFVEGPGVGYGTIIKDVMAGNAVSSTAHGLSVSSSTTLPSFVLSTLTQSDVMFIVDSLTVLIAWRWTANRISNLFL